MILGVSIGIILICFIMKRSKLCGGFLAVWLWILFAWSYGNADYFNYEYKYNNIGNLNTSFELLYVNTQKLANSLGLDYRAYLLIVASCFIVAVLWYTRKNTRNWPYVLSLYAIYPFMMDVVQVRNSMALIFIWVGIDALVNYESKREIIKFCVCIVVATLFHSAAFLCFVLLIPVFFNRRKVIMITTIVDVTGFIATRFLGGIINRTLILLKMTSRYDISSSSVFNIETRKIVIILLLFVTYELGILFIKKSRTMHERIDISQLEIIEKINIIMLITLPLTGFASDVYRLMGGLALVNYTLWANALASEGSIHIIEKRELLFRLYSVVAAFLNIYILVMSSININTVFYPLIQNNMLLK